MIDVTPAYLAGRDYSDQVFDRLSGEWAWGRSSSRELSQDFAWSPDHRFRIGAGQLDPGAWWHIAAAREPLGPPQWQAAFSQETPPEIVTAVTEELARTGSAVDWTGEGHPALKEPTDRRTLIRALRDAGWRSVLRDGTLTLEAPDEHARLHIRLDPPGDPLDLMARPHVHFEAGPRSNGGYPPYWQAMLTTAAPTVVVEALAHALTDTAPLRRDPDWMDERLLAHLTRPEPDSATTGASTPAFTDEDVRRVTALSIANVLEWVSYGPAEEVAVMFAEQTIPSTRGPAGAVTWGQLPQEQLDLATALVTDLVLDAAWRSELLVGLQPEPGRRNWSAAPTSLPRTDLALSDLVFTNDDLYEAAAVVCTQWIHWGDDESGLGDVMDDEVIASTAHGPDRRTWKDLDPDTREKADQAVRALYATTATATPTLFAPQWLPDPPPLVRAGPVYLAGPGHNPGTAARPLLDRGWTVAEGDGETLYTSHCGRLRAQARTTAVGTTWVTTSNSPLSGAERWRAEFDPLTPPEIVAALHTSIAERLTSDPRSLFNPVQLPDTGLQPLIEAGWHDYYSTPATIAWTEPDTEMATIGRNIDPTRDPRGQDTDWVLSGGSLGPGAKEGWYAKLSLQTPAPLLAAVTGAVVDRAPVERLGRDLTPEHRIHLDVTPLPASRPVRSTARRIEAARSRTTRATPEPVPRAADAGTATPGPAGRSR
ncbi:DUF317 domain-containing protein [Kitasatospora sp. NPDC057015]|uniref:DUF317 domain-containing protein n=1 Tax=Kitasatospora sp. NPDC057015 TaxID=3346001 RepID=UPI00362DF074